MYKPVLCVLADDIFTVVGVAGIHCVLGGAEDCV
jgi:hypothetical protein